MPMAVRCAPGMACARYPSASIFAQTSRTCSSVACAFITTNINSPLASLPSPALHRKRGKSPRPTTPEHIQISPIPPQVLRIARNRHLIHQLIIAMSKPPSRLKKSLIFFQRGRSSPGPRHIGVNQKLRPCVLKLLHHLSSHLLGILLLLHQRIGIEIAAGALPASIKTNLRLGTKHPNRILLRRVRFDEAPHTNGFQEWIPVEYLPVKRTRIEMKVSLVLTTH